MTYDVQSSVIDKTLAAAIQAHQLKQRVEAETLYLDVIRQRPKDPQALYLLGALYSELKKHSLARDYLERSIVLRPSHTAAHAMLGVVYSAVGEKQKAAQSFGIAAESTPQSAEAQYNLGRALLDIEHYDAAATAYQKSLTLQPTRAEALNGLATCHLRRGRNDDALAIFHTCVQTRPDYVSGYLGLGRLLIEQKDEEAAAHVFESCLSRHPETPDALLMLGNIRYRQARLTDAEVYFRRLIAVAPHDPAANNYLGAVLQNLGHLSEAEILVRKAYAISPDDAEVLTNLGLVLQDQGKSSEAAGFHRRATVVNPSMPEAWNNLGISQQNQGEWAEALVSYDRAIALKPEFYGAKTNKANTLLAMGRLSEAWPIYRNRFDQKLMASKRRIFPYPVWSGQSDWAGRLLLWTDQGLGDEVFYMSMIQNAQQRVGHCIIECAARMAPLFQRSFPDVTVVARASSPDPRIDQFKPDYQLSLVELGEYLRPTIDSIPAHQGYLKADPALTAALRQQYEALSQGRRIVGISWKSENPKTGRFKSIPLQEWRPILQTKEVLFVSLQYGDVNSDLSLIRTQQGGDIYQDQQVNALHNPDSSAAQIAAMDLVISTSNTTAHFAGGLNIPVWTLVPTGPGALWYWFNERDDSPWYPSMRLFRQPRSGPWSGVLEAVAQKLKQWAVS